MSNDNSKEASSLNQNTQQTVSYQVSATEKGTKTLNSFSDNSTPSNDVIYAIVGSSVGFLVLIAGSIFLIRKRRSRLAEQMAADDDGGSVGLFSELNL